MSGSAGSRLHESRMEREHDPIWPFGSSSSMEVLQTNQAKNHRRLKERMTGKDEEDRFRRTTHDRFDGECEREEIPITLTH